MDCPNGDDELECPSELMSLIEAELGQCIKPSTPSQISDSNIGACQEADFDKQRDCVCTGEWKKLTSFTGIFEPEFLTEIRSIFLRVATSKIQIVLYKFSVLF